MYFLRFKLTWFKDSQPLPAATRYEPDYNFSTCIATLKINNAQKNDLGQYMVLAENIAGKANTACKLFINFLPNIDESPYVNPEAFRLLDSPPNKPESENEPKEHFIPPKVIVPLSDARISEGENVFLVCKIDGYPKPKVNGF